MSTDQTTFQTTIDHIHRIDHATNALVAHLSPLLQEYLDFLPERGSSWEPSKYTSATDYDFREVEGSFVVFESPEFYEYGENTRDVVELPYAFIKDPKGYKKNILEANAAAAKKYAERNRVATEKRIASLKAQLEREEAALTK